MNAPHSREFKQYNLPKYENTMDDHVEHLIDFKIKLMLHAHDGTLMYKQFPTTLQKEGFRWFIELKPNPITLRKQFQ